MTEARAVLANTGTLVEQCLREMHESRLVFYDTETSGLDPNVNHAVGYVLKAHQSSNSYYVPVRHAGGGNLPGCKVPQTADGWRGDLHPFEIEMAKLGKGNGHRRWVGHYLDFDMRVSARHGIYLEGDLEDTMLNAPLIDENQWSFSLDAVSNYLNVKAKLGDDLYRYLADLVGKEYKKPREAMENYWRSDASEPVVYEYAAGDDITTEEVWEAQQKILEEEGLWKVHGIECRLIRTIFRMTQRGVCINEAQLQKVHAKFGEIAERSARGFPDGFRSNAPTDLKAFLADDIGPNWPRNPITAAQIKKANKEGVAPRGSLKFDEETLLLVPRGQQIVANRKMQHARSSFTTPMMERHLRNGRVHTTFNQMKKDDFGTVTGRLSSSDPNLQQVPKRDYTIGPIYRTIFEPEPGHFWDTNDYKQQEYVIFTDYTRIPALVQGYTQEPPIDIHQNVVEVLHRAGFTTLRRDPDGKRINLAILYGMGIATAAAKLQCSEEMARKILGIVHGMFPEIKGTQANPGFMRKAERRAKNRGFVHTYLGRRRHFGGSAMDKAHMAGNSIIQGSSADVTKLKMVEIDDYFMSEGDEAYLMLQVHDALDHSIPIGKEYLATEARRIMTSFGPNDLIEIGIPMRVDNGVGPNWAIATYGEKTVAEAWAK